MKLTQISALSGKKHTLELPYSSEEFYRRYHAWRHGMLIQNAFPDLDAGLREFIFNGVTPDEWNEVTKYAK